MADYSRGRNDGLALALKIVKEDGIEALEQEIKDIQEKTKMVIAIPHNE